MTSCSSWVEERRRGLFLKLLTQSSIRNQYSLRDSKRSPSGKRRFLTYRIGSDFTACQHVCEPNNIPTCYWSIGLAPFIFFAASPFSPKDLRLWEFPRFSLMLESFGCWLNWHTLEFSIWNNTGSTCASVSSHLLCWHCARACRLTTSSRCMLLPATQTHTAVHAAPVWRGLTREVIQISNESQIRLSDRITCRLTNREHYFDSGESLPL